MITLPPPSLFSARRIVLALVGLAFALPLKASAVTYEWWTPASTGSQNWNVSANWLGGTVPNGTSYYALIGHAAQPLLNNSSYTINQNIGAGVTLYSLNIDLGSTSNTISVALSGNSITLGSASGPNATFEVQNVGSTSSVTVGNNLVFAAPSTTFGIPGPQTNPTAPTFTGVLSGSGNVTAGGGGTTLVLNNTSGTASSQSGAWGVTSGVLSLGNSNSSGSASYTLSLNGQVKFANASNDTYTNLFAETAATGTFGFLGVGGVTNTLTNMGNLAGSGTFSFLTSGGTGNSVYKITTANWSPTVALALTGSNLELASASGTQALSGNITGTGALVRSTSGGTSVLSGTNTYSGGTTVTGGTLVTTKAAALSGYNSSGKVVVNGGTLGVQVGGSGWTTAQVDTLLGNATKTSGALGIDTTNGNLTQWTTFTTSNLGSLGLTKLGTNTLTLNATNSYTGTTTVQAGGLVAGANAPSGSTGAFGNATSALVLGNVSTGANDAPSILINGAYTVGRDITVGSVANTAAYNATIGGSNTTGTSTYTGSITLGTLAANYTATLQTATGGTVEFKTGTWTTNNKAIAIGSSGNTGTVQLSNAISTSGGISVNYGTLALNSAFTGNMAVASGTTLSGNGSVIGTTGVAGGTVNGTGLTLTGVTTFNSTGNTLSGTVTSTNGVTLASSAALALNGTLTGSLTAGNGTLTGTGGSVSGATTLNGGTINLTSGTLGSLGVTGGNWNGAGSVTGSVTSSSGTFTIGSGANLTANGGMNVTGGTIAAGNSTSTLTGSINYTSTSNSTFQGTIAGSGKTLTMNATGGILTLAGNNTYTGATTVSAGTLKASASNALGSTSGIMINTGGTLLISANGSLGSTTTITMNSSATGNGTAAALKFSSSYNGTVGTLALNYNSIFDLGTDATGVQIHFSSIFLNGYTLSIYNWTGQTLWEGGTGNNTDQIYAGNTLSQSELQNISFYSGLDASSFRGNGYQIMSGSFLNELGPVPEPATWVAMAALIITGGTMGIRRRSRLATGFL